MKYVRLLNVIALLCIVGCASTKVTNSWKDPGFNPHSFRKVMVLGVSADDTRRRIFEDTFAEVLQKAGVPAVSGYSLFEVRDLQDERSVVQTRLLNAGIDAVIVVTLVDIQTEEVDYSQALDMRWYDVYRGGYRRVTSPGYTTINHTVTLETKMYSVNTGTVVWSGRSQSFMDTGSIEEIRSLVNAIAQKLLKK